MQQQTVDSNFSDTEIENIVDKILPKLKSIEGFKYEVLFKQKAQQFISDFKKKSSQFNQSFKKQPYNLNLLFKTEPIIQQVSQLKKQQNLTKSIKSTLSLPNIFLYSFQLESQYKKYQQMIKNPIIQGKLDDMISSYEVRQQIGKSETLRVEIVELSYKRVMIISPRQFVYVRIFFHDIQSQKSNLYWILTFGIPYEKKTDKTTAEIILTVQKITQNYQKNNIHIKVYSQVDMKTAVKSDVTRNKGFAEIKKYVQKIYDYSKL